mmetsp:Transcript_46798/g.111313  ORF Transcript_46798/g.111313 Transcript_46798/m.111313 type:complete len:230 (-) Transcript_46798:1095-1784(-)
MLRFQSCQLSSLPPALYLSGLLQRRGFFKLSGYAVHLGLAQGQRRCRLNHCWLVFNMSGCKSSNISLMQQRIDELAEVSPLLHWCFALFTCLAALVFAESTKRSLLLNCRQPWSASAQLLSHGCSQWRMRAILHAGYGAEIVHIVSAYRFQDAMSCTVCCSGGGGDRCLAQLHTKCELTTARCCCCNICRLRAGISALKWTCAHRAQLIAQFSILPPHCEQCCAHFLQA